MYLLVSKYTEECLYIIMVYGDAFKFSSLVVGMYLMRLYDVLEALS